MATYTRTQTIVRHRDAPLQKRLSPPRPIPHCADRPAAMAAPPLSPLLCSAVSSYRATLLAPRALPYRVAARPMVSPCSSPPCIAPSLRRAGARAPPPCAAKRGGAGGEASSSDGEGTRVLLQAALWGAEAAYILWLFLLPYAPGDPLWAISQATITDLVGLSLNFFFILPLINSAGVHLLESPVMHPVDEGLFNFVIAWTLLFAPLLFTDARRDRYKGSLDILWGCQMFLTNTFLIPYMAIRLNEVDKNQPPPQTTKLSSVIVRGASGVGITGGLVCILSVAWAFFGRADADFGGVLDRWQYAQDYFLTERFAYAFLWDIFLYSMFQPWLIGDNLQNVKPEATAFVNVARFIPVLGIVAYLLCLEEKKD
ncbi:uncharacterized protein LOC119355394 [Triticum dicoccoides]|uniref:uncharacterized protein LOC119355394 n=1 Tax=Triticum dicoccoides TaxID=85692 RepID=UPI00188E527B|nr:uncharacterized protein LOC119355394 [Triticum dicoccoides]